MRTLVVDGNNILLRSLFGVKTPLESHGVPTGALVGFINQLSRAVRQVKPDHMVVCWDGGNLWRQSISDEYKAKRRVDNESADRHDSSPFDLAKQFLSFAGIHHVTLPDVEADDIIAHYWKHRPEGEFFILSSDKDFMQLVDRDVTVLRPSNHNLDRWRPARVEAEYGAPPDLLPYVFALSGDTVDGVYGIKGVGYKTAAKMLREHNGDIEALLDSDHKKVQGQRERVIRNISLVDLRTYAQPLDLPPIPPFVPTQPDSMMWPYLLVWLNTYEMRSVASKIAHGLLWDDEVNELPSGV